MGTTVAAKGLAAKLAEIMGEVNRIPKRGHNDFHNYDYVMEADLTEAVREKLSSRGIALIPSVKERHRYEILNKDGIAGGSFDYVTIDFMLIDSESGETLTSTMVGSGYDKGDKGIYKAITGATKYWIYKTFLIPTGDDPESDTRTDRDAGERSAKAVAEAKLREIEQEKKIKAQEEALKNPAAKSEQKPGCITPPQQKRLWAIAKSAGWENDEIKTLLKSKYSIEHTSDVPKALYEEICKTFEAGTQAPPNDDIPF